jgi:hypothetical protein
VLATGPTAYVAPLYPLFLAAAYKATGGTPSFEWVTDHLVLCLHGLATACIGGCGGSVGGILNFSQIQGALYFPKAAISFSGCCQSSSGQYYTAYEIVVADSMSFTWDYFIDDYTSLPGGSAVKKTVLAE